MIYLAPKASSDTVDYQLDFIDFVPTTFNLDGVDVEIINAGNDESPIELTVTDTSLEPSPRDDTKTTVVLMWLQGGTPGTTYKGKITVSDNESVSPDRSITREFIVAVKEL